MVSRGGSEVAVHSAAQRLPAFAALAADRKSACPKPGVQMNGDRTPACALQSLVPISSLTSAWLPEVDQGGPFESPGNAPQLACHQAGTALLAEGTPASFRDVTKACAASTARLSAPGRTMTTAPVAAMPPINAQLCALQPDSRRISTILACRLLTSFVWLVTNISTCIPENGSRRLRISCTAASEMLRGALYCSSASCAVAARSFAWAAWSCRPAMSLAFVLCSSRWWVSVSSSFRWEYRWETTSQTPSIKRDAMLAQNHAVLHQAADSAESQPGTQLIVTPFSKLRKPSR